MRRVSQVIASFTILLLLTPVLTEGRAGAQGSTGGSFKAPSIQRPSGGGVYSPYRGSGSYNPSYRGSQQRSQAYLPNTYRSDAYQAKSSSGGFFSGLLTGIVGSWLFNKVFHEKSANDITQKTAPYTSGKSTGATPIQEKTPSMGGWLFRILLLVLAFYLLRHLFKRQKNLKESELLRRENPSQGDNVFNLPSSIFGEHKRSNQPDVLVRNNINLGPNDYTAFANTLENIQNAWSQKNLGQLQQLTTPEMYNYFMSVLEQNKREGITNYIEHVRVTNQELQEAWEDDNALYAIVALTWDAIDYSVDESRNIIAGDRHTPSQVTEVWTFVRPINGPWVVGEIQQV